MARISSYVNDSNVVGTDRVIAAMGAERVSEIEASLDAQLAELATPTSVTLTIQDPIVE